MDQVAHIQCLDAVSKPQKDSIILGQLNQIYYETKHDLESSFHFLKCHKEQNIGSATQFISTLSAQSQPAPSSSPCGLIVTQATPCLPSCLPGHRSCHLGTVHPFQPIPWISQVWLDRPPPNSMDPLLMPCQN
jgi:hypothetical protein